MMGNGRQMTSEYVLVPLSTLISALCVPGIERHTVTKQVLRNMKIKRQQSCSIP